MHKKSLDAPITTKDNTLCEHLHMQVKSEFLQSLLKNKLTDFIASASEAVSGIFLPPPKLRPQKKRTMFTNMKNVYF